MTVFMYPYDFKIRCKKDAERFLNMADDKAFSAPRELYWWSTTTDYYLNVPAKLVFSRPRAARGDIFWPYCQVKDSLETIWKLRKFINRQRFCD